MIPKIEEITRWLQEISLRPGCFATEQYDAGKTEALASETMEWLDWIEREQKRRDETARLIQDQNKLIEDYARIMQPMKPVWTNGRWECPVCRAYVGMFNDDDYHDYCRRCGKALLWTEQTKTEERTEQK
jgi:hypothetical protein